MSEKLRVQAYIENVEQALQQLAEKRLEKPYEKLVELARLYVDDARYYLEKGDTFTALACVAYAEGLIDALRWLGVADFEWKALSSLLSRPKVVVAGSFELLHPGHVELLRRAWELGRVHVIVARDAGVERFKGRPPLVPEEQRLQVISAVKYVSKAVLGSERDVVEPLRILKPDIILLGPDQWVDETWLEKRLEEEGVSAKIVRLEKRLECEYCSTTRIACRVLSLIPREKCVA
ncbi:MAG TPA: cytidylyltransferase family protein [Pyrodictiaceae archaeon]|nr:cytidylyltransferase family protein [Pyrodictiaceae archaeon]